MDTITLFFENGHVCKCNYPFKELPKRHGDLKDADKLKNTHLLWSIKHCKDCKYFVPDEPCVGGTYSGCKQLEGRDGGYLEVDKNFYCAFFEGRVEQK